VSGNCCYRVSSPIIIDLESQGFHLTSPGQGVQFRVFAHDNRRIQVAWTEAGSHNGWLVLDRNKNGLIDDFSELFGDQTPQPPLTPGQHRNGFRALAVYDLPENGGNGDGWISREDAIFDQLRVWVDLNHDGISQPGELFTLTEVGIAAMSLDYKLSQLTDANGNMFRFRSSVKDSTGSETNKVIYDVLLQLGSSQSESATADWFVRPSEACVNQSWPELRDLMNGTGSELCNQSSPRSDGNKTDISQR
jgi:hypothetical protein